RSSAARSAIRFKRSAVDASALLNIIHRPFHIRLSARVYGVVWGRIADFVVGADCWSRSIRIVLLPSPASMLKFGRCRIKNLAFLMGRSNTKQSVIDFPG